MLGVCHCLNGKNKQGVCAVFQLTLRSIRSLGKAGMQIVMPLINPIIHKNKDVMSVSNVAQLYSGPYLKNSLGTIE